MTLGLPGIPGGNGGGASLFVPESEEERLVNFAAKVADDDELLP